MAMSVAAAFIVCCVGVSTGPARAGDDGAQFLLFSGADLWRDGRFVHGGLLWSPGGLDRDGFTAKLMASGGQYRHRSGALGNDWVICTEEELQLLPGWRFKSRPAGGQGFRRARHQKRYHQSLRSLQPPARDIRRRPHRGQSVVRADARDHDRGGCVAVVDRHQLFGARCLWLAAARLVLSRPGGADISLASALRKRELAST